MIRSNLIFFRQVLTDVATILSFIFFAQTVEYLLSRGAQAEIRDRHGVSPAQLGTAAAAVLVNVLGHV